VALLGDEPKVPELIKWTKEDVERLADILALVTVAWAIAASKTWIGKDNWIVALAMLAAFYFLVVEYNGPLRAFLRRIFYAILETLVELINGLWAWIQQAQEHYGGNFFRMVIDIVLWTLAAWVFPRFFNSPSVKLFWDKTTQVIKAALEIALDATKFVLKLVQDTQKWVKNAIDELFLKLLELGGFVYEQLGELRQFFLDYLLTSLKALRREIESDVNAIFAKAEADLLRVQKMLEHRMQEIMEWILQELGAVTVRIGDVTVRLSFFTIYQTLLRSGAIHPGGEFTQADALESNTEQDLAEASPTHTLIAEALENVLAVAEERPIDGVYLFVAQSLDELREEAVARVGPPPVVA